MEGVALDVAQSELHVKGGVVEVTEPVVGQGELVTLHLDSVGRQALEVSHPQDVELPALTDHNSEHGDSLKLAGEHRELAHIAQLQPHGRQGLAGDIAQVEPPLHPDILQGVALHYQIVDVGQLDVLQLPALLSRPGGQPRIEDLKNKHQIRFHSINQPGIRCQAKNVKLSVDCIADSLKLIVVDNILSLFTLG